MTLVPAAPAFTVNEILITHAKALAGNVTPGDTAGYPVRIGASGSYVLGSNLTPPVGQTAIQIFANNVTIDLSGFAYPAAEGAWYGIAGAAGADSTTIESGTITSSSSTASTAQANIGIVDNITKRNGGTGIGIGHYAVIKSSVVVGNGAMGSTPGFLGHPGKHRVQQRNHRIKFRAKRASTVVGNTINEKTTAMAWRAVAIGIFPVILWSVTTSPAASSMLQPCCRSTRMSAKAPAPDAVNWKTQPRRARRRANSSLARICGMIMLTRPRRDGQPKVSHDA